MPIYEYECLKCGAVWELMQSHSEPPPKKHTCGSKRVRRLMSRTSFVLKGSGWYITDYGKGSGNGRGPGKDTSEGKSESKDKSEGKSESKDKSEGKSESKDKSEGKSESKDKSKAAAKG